ncbi:MAG: hypothetical protein R3B70_01285 [Polyangiaceae bacterium]
MSCLAGALCALFLSQGSQSTSLGSPAEGFANFGGSNHWVYDYGTADGHNTNQSWYLPALNLRSTVPTMEHDMSDVYAQMVALRASGQTAYVIPIWNKDLRICEPHGCDGLPDGVWGNVVDNGAGAMRPQHRQNLAQLVQWAIGLGFERIVVRFFYNDDPETWPAWDNKRYERVRGFIFDGRQAAVDAFNLAWGERPEATYPVLLFDLGGEQAGRNEGQMGPFIQTLWSDYTSAFGTYDTLGFSFAWAPGRFTTQLGWLASTGVLPERWAFDIYNGADVALSEVHAEMGELRNQPIDILETYFNDPGTAAAIGAARSALPLLNIDSVVQWPLYAADGAAHPNNPPGFSQGAVDAQLTSSTFTSYAGFVASRKLFMTSSNADVMAFSNIDCGASVPSGKGAGNCTVDLYRGQAPAGMRLLVYVSTYLGTGNIACDNPPGITPLTWVNPAYPYYDFTAYYFPESIPCKNLQSPPTNGQVPVAEGRIHF